tara:strand:+ start:360 stop:1217 length:858 start_codon:yes stop_codon:yes gene_type:complete
MIKFYLFLLILFYNSCTKNIFWEDPSKSELSIAGYAISEDNNRSVPIAVWIEELDHHTFTDSNGYFSLPISGTQSSNGNLSGASKIYYFIHNYKLDSSIINFTNGQFSKNQSDFSVDGELLDTIKLKKIFSGEIELNFGANSLNSFDTVSASFYINTFLDVSLQTYKYTAHQSDFNSGLIFKSLNKNSFSFYRFSMNNEVGTIIYDQLNTINYDKNLEITWDYKILCSSLNLDSDTYEVFPFFIIDHGNFPIKMIKSIAGDSALFFSKYYLEIPCDINPDTLIIN